MPRGRTRGCRFPWSSLISAAATATPAAAALGAKACSPLQQQAPLAARAGANMPETSSQGRCGWKELATLTILLLLLLSPIAAASSWNIGGGGGRGEKPGKRPLQAVSSTSGRVCCVACCCAPDGCTVCCAQPAKDTGVRAVDPAAALPLLRRAAIRCQEPRETLTVLAPAAAAAGEGGPHQGARSGRGCGATALRGAGAQANTSSSSFCSCTESKQQDTARDQACCLSRSAERPTHQGTVQFAT